jgi:hypothetical protein
MVLFRLFLGIALLVMGRRLFWLFLGGLGFIFSFDFAEKTIHGQSNTVLLVVALFVGALGAMVAIFLQKLAIVVGGFFAGGYLLSELMKVFGIGIGDYHTLLFIAGGLIGAILMSVVFGWTLIILSSLIGSMLIFRTFHFGQQLSEFLFICLVILGISIQSGLIRKKYPQ